MCLDINVNIDRTPHSEIDLHCLPKTLCLFTLGKYDTECIVQYYEVNKILFYVIIIYLFIYLFLYLVAVKYVFRGRITLPNISKALIHSMWQRFSVEIYVGRH